MTLVFKQFHDLTVEEFHDLLQLRINVFVVEQNCPYPELDGKDKLAYHLILKNHEGKTIATCRILPPNISYKEVSIGRVVSMTTLRKTGVGRKLMSEALKHIEQTFGKVPVRISAQEYLEDFYKSYDFVSTAKRYLEDDIPHVEMLRN